MDIKKLLSSHKEIDERIDLRLEEIAQLRAAAERVTVFHSDTPSPKGGYSDKVGRTAAKIMDLEIKINEDIDRLVDLKDRIMDIVTLLDDEKQRTIIERRYILHETSFDIAEKLDISQRHVNRLHNQAIEKLESIFGRSEEAAEDITDSTPDKSDGSPLPETKPAPRAAARTKDKDSRGGMPASL